MGSSDTIVVSTVSLATTRLPGSTFLSEIRPSTGAVTTVHSRLSCSRPEGGLGGLLLGLRDSEVGGPLRIVALRHRPRFDEGGGAVDFRLLEGDLGFGARDLGLRSFHGELEGALIEGE